MELENTLIYVLIIIFGIGLFVLFQDQMSQVDTSSWTFTGADFAAQIFQVMPYIYLIAIILIPGYFIIKQWS